jgi:hypothetical protein
MWLVAVRPKPHKPHHHQEGNGKVTAYAREQPATIVNRCRRGAVPSRNH